jgi:hypothetical protein
MLAPVVSGPGDDVAENGGNDGVRLTDEQRLDWLQLIRSDNVGPRGIMAQTPQDPAKPKIGGNIRDQAGAHGGRLAP